VLLTSNIQPKSLITICANIFACLAIILLCSEIFAALLGKPSIKALILYSSWLFGSIWAKWYVMKISDQKTTGE
jgi:hypothetical protein